MSVVDRVRSLVEPILADLGLGLYDLEYTGGKLLVTVDRAGGVDLDTITLATRLIGRELDHADPIPGRYHLEVSSPGLERPLRTAEHFRRSIGAEVSVRTHPSDDVPRRVHGVLVAADDEAFVVRAVPEEGEVGEPTDVRIPLAQLDRAKTVFTWGPAPKPGGKKPGTKKPAVKAKTPAVKTKKTTAGGDDPTAPQEADAS